MPYSRSVKVSNWYQAREQEPRDYDINRAPVRNLKLSTYRRFGPPPPKEGEPDVPLDDKTTYNLQNKSVEEHFQKKNESKATAACGECERPMPKDLTFDRAVKGTDEKKSYADPYLRMLTHTNDDKLDRKDIMQTTTNIDYVYRGNPDFVPKAVEVFEEEPTPEVLNERYTHSLAFRRMPSQFTDQHMGTGKYYNESGQYANMEHKQQHRQYQPGGALQL